MYVFSLISALGAGYLDKGSEAQYVFSPAFDFSNVGTGRGPPRGRLEARDTRGRDARDTGAFCIAKQIREYSWRDLQRFFMRGVVLLVVFGFYRA